MNFLTTFAHKVFAGLNKNPIKNSVGMALLAMSLLSCNSQSAPINNNPMPTTVDPVSNSVSEPSPPTITTVTATITPVQLAPPTPVPTELPNYATSEVTTLPITAETQPEWTTYTPTAGGYRLPVRSNWPIIDKTGDRGLVVEFRDPEGQPNARGDDILVIGGVNVSNYNVDSPRGADLANGLPDNHKEIIFEQEHKTPIGPSKIFTLRRDSPPDTHLVWFEQHAVVLANNTFYAIWLRIPEPITGAPVPELVHMLDGFQLTQSIAAPTSVTRISGWTSYDAPDGTYSVPVPIDWPAVQVDGQIVFQDVNGLAEGDDWTVQGGIYRTDQPPNNRGSPVPLSALPPDHGRILFRQNIATSGGEGTVYSVTRTSPTRGTVWYEQYAVMPTGDNFLVIWLKVPEPADGEPVPELAHMLQGLRVV
jgi:hypothetical protein